MKTIASICSASTGLKPVALVGAFYVSADDMLPESVIQRATDLWGNILHKEGLLRSTLLPLQLKKPLYDDAAASNVALLRLFNLLEHELVDQKVLRNSMRRAKKLIQQSRSVQCTRNDMMESIRYLTQAVSCGDSQEWVTDTVKTRFFSVVHPIRELLEIMPLDDFNILADAVDCCLGDSLVLKLDERHNSTLLKSVAKYLFYELFYILPDYPDFKTMLVQKTISHFQPMRTYVQKMLSLAHPSDERGQEKLRQEKHLIKQVEELRDFASRAGGSKSDELASAEKALHDFLDTLAREEVFNMYRCVCALMKELVDEKSLVEFPCYLTQDNITRLAEGEKLETRTVGVVPKYRFDIPGFYDTTKSEWQKIMTKELLPWLQWITVIADPGSDPWEATEQSVAVSPQVDASEGYRNPFIDVKPVLWIVNKGLLRSVAANGTAIEGCPYSTEYLLRRAKLQELSKQTECWANLLYRSKVDNVINNTNFNVHPGHGSTQKLAASRAKTATGTDGNTRKVGTKPRKPTKPSKPSGADGITRCAGSTRKVSTKPAKPTATDGSKPPKVDVTCKVGRPKWRP